MIHRRAGETPMAEKVEVRVDVPSASGHSTIALIC